MDGGKSLYVIRIAHSGKELRLKCVHYKKKSRTVLTDDAAFACKYIAQAKKYALITVVNSKICYFVDK